MLRRKISTERQLYAGERRAHELTREAIQWLRGHRNRKFLLWIHYFDPHDPYYPPDRYKTLVSEEAYRGPFDGDIRKTRYDHISIWGKTTSTLSGTDRQHIIDLYDGEIRYLDEWIGRLLDEIADLNLENDTLVALVSDHGESLGEHSTWGHGYSLHQTEIAVPLIVRFPGSAGGAGRVVHEPVQAVDLVPTILSFLDIPAPPGMQGRNLNPLIGLPRTDSEHLALSFFRRQVAARSARHKYIVIPDRLTTVEQLFDITSDPEELTDLSIREPLVLETFRKRLGQQVPQMAPILEQGQRIHEELRALGYLD